ncbi:hypothetical protein HDV01_006817 [Terramyces sp. JEL0728]|nr:hypothetical protein HDV01_006817 [Terramyces sp. JEL0728]
MTTQLYVGNLPYSATWQDLKELFSKVAVVERANIVQKNGRSKGFGTVSFKSHEDALEVIDAFNGYEFDGRTLEVRFDKALPKRLPSENSGNEVALYVGNLDWSVQWQDLKDLFKEAGRVVRCEIPSDAQGRSKGFGIVVMASNADAERAKDMYDGHVFCNRDMQVRYDRNESGKKEIRKEFARTKVNETSSNRLYVGNLSPSTQWQDLKDLFKSVGTVIRANVIQDKDGSVGYGQVVMATAAEAELAIEKLNGVEFQSSAITVKQDDSVEKNSGVAAGATIYVGNLPFSARWQDLKDIFREGFNPIHAVVAMESATKSKGYGMVKFATIEEAERAIAEFNGAVLSGRTLAVRMDKYSSGNEE